ncbi:MAG: carbohydrate kinase [candidate division KSB1 bacterium]|nr:carbohydrate kinase [candidate division KSB1 bacterium]MDZ7301323.1 carbohydrate kinase [candidate division KSB1 bacterium]MDZ7310792.1 carbohydrate kinase [candidate division KSB1 bacterium]
MEQPREKYTIVGIGEVLWDIYRDRRHVGGTPANFTIHATQLGDEGVLVSRVGDDGMGRDLIRALRQRQLMTECIQVDDKRGTGTIMISLDIKGVPTFRCSHDVAFDYLQYLPELETLASRANAVLFGTLAQRSPIARQTIRRFVSVAKNAVRLFNVNSRASVAEMQHIVPESLAMADILQMNHEEMKLLQILFRREADPPRKFIDFLFKKYDLKMVAITHGESGCELFDGSGVSIVDGLPVQVIDTTGAGDAFAAGMMHKFLRNAPLDEIAEFANLLGAFLCTQSGATPVFRRQDIEIFRDSYE